MLRQRCKQHASLLSQRGERKPVHTEEGALLSFLAQAWCATRANSEPYFVIQEEVSCLFKPLASTGCAWGIAP